jgi:hypothetical protein
VSIAGLALLAGLVGLAALSKISVGFVLGAAVAAGFAFQGRKNPWRLIAALLVGILPPIVVYLAYPVSAGTDEPMFVLFDFFTYERPAIYALLLASIITFLALRRMPSTVSEKSLVVALLSGMWAGLGASYVLNAPAGAQYYFSDPGSWLGLLVIPVLGMVPRWLSARAPKSGFLIVSGMIVTLLALHDDKLRGVEQIKTWQTVFSKDAAPDASGAGDVLFESGAVERVLESVIDHATAVDAVLVDGDFAAFWTSQKTCWAASILLPALTGKPMLQGIVPDAYGCEITPYYGFSEYALAEGRAPTDLGQATICKSAAARGFENLLVVTAETAVVISCGTDSQAP